MNNLFEILRASKYGCWIYGEYYGILGYSDDNLLLAPSIYALQEMLKICEEYAALHDLKFSTEANPKRCKTKCMAFLKRQRELSDLKLSGNILPWVASGKHLGVTLDDKNDGLKHDMMRKRAQYISKNNEIMQEFRFCHPLAQFHINQIYNSSFTGSPIWNLFCREAEMLEKTWNTSVRVMFGLPMNTHRFFIQPVSGKKHLKNILLGRFLSFLEQITKTSKKLPGHLLDMIKHDVRSTTGANLRNIMRLVGKDKIEDVEKKDVEEVEYAEVKPEDTWKIDMVKEIVEVKNDELWLQNMTQDGIDYTLHFICTI